MKNLVISKKSESVESVLFISQAHIILIHYFSFTWLYCHLNFSFSFNCLFIEYLCTYNCNWWFLF